MLAQLEQILSIGAGCAYIAAAVVSAPGLDGEVGRDSRGERSRKADESVHGSLHDGRGVMLELSILERR